MSERKLGCGMLVFPKLTLLKTIVKPGKRWGSPPRERAQ